MVARAGRSPQLFWLQTIAIALPAPRAKPAPRTKVTIGKKYCEKARDKHQAQKHSSKNEDTIVPKKGIHPEWYPEAKVYCNGEVVMTVGSTSPELNVDVWSGNHPFFTGTQKIIDTEGRVERFRKRYARGGKKKQEEKKEE